MGAEASGSAGEPGGVLVIEDDAAMRESLAEVLSGEGYRVSTAAGGFEAFYQLDGAAPPRVILLDLMMGLMSGWEFRQRQKRDPRLAEIPTVIVSAVGDLEHQARSLDAADYVPKPVDIARLLRVVARFAR